MVYLPVSAAEYCRSEAAWSIQVALTGTLRFTRPTCDCEDCRMGKASASCSRPSPTSMQAKERSDVPVIIQGAPQRKPFALEKRAYKVLQEEKCQAYLSTFIKSGGRKRKSAASAKPMVMAVNSPMSEFSLKADWDNTINPAISTREVTHSAMPTVENA